MPDCNLIRGNNIRSIGAANKILPAKTKTIPIKIEIITIKNLILFEIFWVFAFANQVKIKIKIIKIIIPKKR